MTFAEIQTMVTEGLHPALKSLDGYSIDRVKHYINRGYWDFVRRTKCIEDVVSITTVAEQNEYTKTDSANLEYVYHIYEVRYVISGESDNGYKLRPYPGGHRALPRVLTTGRPDQYWFEYINTKDGVTVGTWPVNSGTGDTIKLYAFMFPSAELDGDSDVPDIKSAWHDALALYALWKIFNLFSYHNTSWGRIANDYGKQYYEQVQSYNYDLALDSEDELPQLFAETADGDW